MPFEGCDPFNYKFVQNNLNVININFRVVAEKCPRLQHGHLYSIRYQSLQYVVPPAISSVHPLSFIPKRHFSLEHVPFDKRTNIYNPSLFFKNEKKLELPKVKFENTLQVRNTTGNSLQPSNENKPDKPTLWQRVKSELLHYYHGFRLLGLEVRIASGIFFLRVLRGKTLTRRERKQSEKTRQRLKAKLEMTRFLQETLVQASNSSSEKSLVPTIGEFHTFMKKIQESGEVAKIDDILRFSKLFEDQITLDSLDIKQLKMICQILSVPTIGPSNLLRFQIHMRVRQLKAEDLLIAKEGIDQIPPWELQSLCQERGMRSIGLTKERLSAQLSQWLTLHVEKNVPISLLLFSQALYVTEDTIDQLPLKAVGSAIAKLPAAATEEATTSMLEASPSTLAKIELLRKEQANIVASRREKKAQERAAAAVDKKQPKLALGDGEPTPAEPLIDKAKELEPVPVASPELPTQDAILEKSTKPPPVLTKEDKKQPEILVGEPIPIVPTSPDTSPVEIVPDKVEPSDAAEITEITSEDLAHLGTAIAQSSDALHGAALHELKEEVAETAKAQKEQKRQTLVVASKAASKLDKKTQKAAIRLESRVSHLIEEMDTMVEKLLDERKQILKDIALREVHVGEAEARPSKEVKTEVLPDNLQSQQDRVVDINDLLLSLRRIQKVSDDAKWQRILDVLDEDHDGKIELKHVLSVIELLGSENIKLSPSEMSRVLEMIDNESLASQQSADDDGEPKTIQGEPGAPPLHLPSLDKSPDGSVKSKSPPSTT